MDTAAHTPGAGPVTQRLAGQWRVRRVSGFLPPGVTKRIGPGDGWTYLLGVPVGHFRVVWPRFLYRFWPVVDELEESAPGRFVGTGRLLGWRFCRFALEPIG